MSPWSSEADKSTEPTVGVYFGLFQKVGRCDQAAYFKTETVGS
jgi:hypothetical protein